MRVSGFVPCLTKEGPVPAPDHLIKAVAELARETEEPFRISDGVVLGTEMYLVTAANYQLPARYTRQVATLGFRVPSSFPDAGPEDSFFLWPADIKLTVADPIRNSNDINRAGVDPSIAKGILDGAVLSFSWHLWNKVPWERRKHTLVDHYRHVLRRFEMQEHD
ncbi:MAG: Prokaryotic family [Pedosphaera sp.]|nr:Prokaryotic family [Pedosphaera sp.]